MSSVKNQRKSVSMAKEPKMKIRDATLCDIKSVDKRLKQSTIQFFGQQNLEQEFKSSVYSLIVEHESGKMSTYVNISSVPNISALPKGSWLDWMKHFYAIDKVAYGNSLFLTYLVIDDPYNAEPLRKIYTEVFLREPKVKFIFTVYPPIDSLFEQILSVHAEQVYSVDPSVSKRCQSIFVCERYNIIPRIRIRRALSEDNDDLVEIIDEKLKIVRKILGDYYIAELVLQDDPTETIIVAEISNVTIGMMWINSNVHRRALADNFEIAAYGNFVRQQQGSKSTETRTVVDLVRKRSEIFFEKYYSDQEDALIRQKSDSINQRMSLNNLYSVWSELSEESETDDEKSKLLFHRWEIISKSFKSPRHYVDETRKPVFVPSSTEATNAFAIQLHGLTSSIDPRRIFDLIAGAFASYKEKDYCIISLSASDASTGSLNGPLLRYFSRLIPRPGCKISDVVYVTHRNSFLSEIEIRQVMPKDVPDIEDLTCLTGCKGRGMYTLADILQRTTEYLEDPWSPYDVLIMRCGGCPIGFAIVRQNCIMSELQENFLLYDIDGHFADSEIGELMYLHLHPAFLWEWTFVACEIFRLTGFVSLYFRLTRQHDKPVLNSILLNMCPIMPRKRLGETIDPYALYYLNVKRAHLFRIQIESKIVIIGFNEVCNGFLRTLIFSPNAKYVQCLNITVITPCPGYVEAAYDTKSFEKECSMFFKEKNQFDAVYLRKLELRTFVSFIGGQVKGIQSESKRILMEGGKSLRYDKLFLMCSSRYGTPKILTAVPANYLEMNGRLDKIIFHHKIRLLVKEFTEHTTPILVYGVVAFAHSCVNALIQLGVKPSQICLITPRSTKIRDFPETFADEYIVDLIYKKEQEAGVKIYKDLKFIDWKMHAHDNAIESVTFQSDVEQVELNCLAFICYHEKVLSEQYRDLFIGINLDIADNRVIIDHRSKTNIPNIFACGRITQYQDLLFAKGFEQKDYNQIELGNQLAVNFIHECRTGEETSLLATKFTKPVFRQSEVIGGILYAGLRKPGLYVPRDIRKCVQSHGFDLITCDGKDEYCRIYVENGFITEISCITRRYNNLEVLFRIYNIHESLLDNIRTKCDRGEIENLLDYIHEASFSAVLHDQFTFLRKAIRKRSLYLLDEFLKDKKRTDKDEVTNFLKDKGMEELIQKDLIAFLSKHWKSLSPYYAIPSSLPA